MNYKSNNIISTPYLFALIFLSLFTKGTFAANESKEDVSKRISRAEVLPVYNGFGFELAFVPRKHFNLTNTPAGQRYETHDRHDGSSRFSQKLDKLLQKSYQQWIEKAENECLIRQCIVKKSKESARVLFSNGFWYKIKLDVGAIEITAKPLTFEELYAVKDILQYIFDIATSLDLVINPNRGFHIHLDITHFDRNPALFLAFFNDMQNNPKLFLGILGLRPNNPPLATRSKEMRKAYEEILQKFKMNSRGWTIETLALEIYEKVYKIEKTYINGVRTNILPDQRRNFALNLENLLPRNVKTKKENPFKTLEIRALELPPTPDYLLAMINFFEKRLRFLRLNYQKGDFFTYNNIHIPLSRKSTKIKSQVAEPEKLRQVFKNLIEETGLDWQTYKWFLPTLVQDSEISQALSEARWKTNDVAEARRIIEGLPAHTFIIDEHEGEIPLAHWVLRWAISLPQSEDKFLLAKELLRRDVEVGATYQGETVLRDVVKHALSGHAVISDGVLGLFDQLFSENNPLYHESETSFSQILAHAIENRATPLVKLLLPRGVPNLFYPIGNDPQPLHMLVHALKAGALDIVELLLDNGADIHTRGPHQMSLLNYAALCPQENFSALKLLRQRGAKITLDDIEQAPTPEARQFLVSESEKECEALFNSLF